MTLDAKLQYVGRWNKQDALACWTRYHELYEQKYNGALFAAMIRGETDTYIQRELDVFRRYARMWHYQTHSRSHSLSQAIDQSQVCGTETRATVQQRSPFSPFAGSKPKRSSIGWGNHK